MKNNVDAKAMRAEAEGNPFPTETMAEVKTVMNKVIDAAWVAVRGAQQAAKMKEQTILLDDRQFILGIAGFWLLRTAEYIETNKAVVEAAGEWIQENSVPTVLYDLMKGATSTPNATDLSPEERLLRAIFGEDFLQFASEIRGMSGEPETAPTESEPVATS